MLFPVEQSGLIVSQKEAPSLMAGVNVENPGTTNPILNPGGPPPPLGQVGFAVKYGGSPGFNQLNTDASYLPNMLVLQDLAQSGYPWVNDNGDIYLLSGFHPPQPTMPTQPWSTNPDEIQFPVILEWSGNSNYGPLAQYTTTSLTAYNPTSILAPTGDPVLVVTDSGSNADPAGQDELYIFGRPLGGQPAVNPSTVCSIYGADTGLNEPTASAVDALGNLYVANAGNNTITVYASATWPYSAPWSCGDVAPVTTLATSPSNSINPLDYPVSMVVSGP